MHHYKSSNSYLRKIFKSNIIEKQSWIKYWEFENDTDKIPNYKFLYTNFNWFQRRRLAKAYRELLRKTLIKNSGGTSDVYLSKNKQLFRESRLSNLLERIKKMAKRETPSLDLHGVRHKDVEILVENFVLENENRLPVDIITGHSEQMKELVKEVLEYYGFEYEDGDFFNKGYIHVIN